MTFHPDNNLPGCMMPDGGDCCAGHAAVCEDWHKQSRVIDLMRAALVDAAQFIDSVKPDAVSEGWWSDWDQEMRGKIALALSSQDRGTL